MTGPATGEGLGVYVHFPFCSHRCHYCDYAVEASARPPVGDWLEAVEGELGLRFRAEGWDRGPAVETVYVGGGTPSLLGPAGVARLGSLLRERFRVEDGAEWTVEANPEGVDRDVAREWRRAGVTRINLGVQSFDDRALRWLGRLHDAAAVRRAVDAVWEAGPGGPAVDLLYALPDGLRRDWEGDLERVVELELPHVTLYGLSASPATPLGRWSRSGAESPAGEASRAAAYLRASRLLGAAGWEHYTVTSLARPGGRCAHTAGYWTGRAYLGLGPSAHGFLPPRRYWNAATWREYRNSIAGGTLPVAGRERLGEPERETERIWLALRTREGIEGALARRLHERAPALIDRLRREGWLRDESSALAATPEGWLRLDDLAAGLASALDGPVSPPTPGRSTAPPEHRERKDPIH